MTRRAWMLVGFGALCLFLNLWTGFQPYQTDLEDFLNSSQAWRDGRSPYGLGVSYRPNLNPPWFVALLAPLTWLSFPRAFALWTALNLVVVVVTIVAIRQRRHDVPAWALVLGLFLITPAWQAWGHGQVIWWVFACVTFAWLSPSEIRAGLWLAPAIMLKPPLALMALFLPRRTWLAAGVASGGGTLLLVPVFGVPMWREWLASGGAVFWIGNFSNGSLWGMAARLSEPYEWSVMMNEIWPPFYALMAVTWLAIAVTVWRERRRDNRWALAFLTHLFASPLGWSYYLPCIMGPVAASTLRRRWLIWPLVLFLTPVTIWTIWEWIMILNPSVPALAVRWPVFTACVCLWMALLPKRPT